MHKLSVLSLVLVAGAASAANADTINALITADNHYAFYSSDGVGTWGYHGRNELGSGGSPGTYNWSEAESYSFNTVGGYLYIAAWSDDSIAQGLLANLTINGVDYSSGNAAWEVFRSNADLDDGGAEPDLVTMATLVTIANVGNLWESIYVGGGNGAQAPWGAVPGIVNPARWMWVNNPNQPDPFQPGSDYGEMLIFRIAVPTPGAASLMGLGLLAAARRRRA
jgi:hypothetical protein